MKKHIAIILAAGKGTRMKSNIPKQYMAIEERPVIYYTIKAFEESYIDEIILVTGKDDIEYVKKEIVDKYHLQKVKEIVGGGANRYDSVNAGINAIINRYDTCYKLCESTYADKTGKQRTTDQSIIDKIYVHIHDGARPCVSQEELRNMRDNVELYNACILAVKVKDTIKIADSNNNVLDTPKRDTLWAVHTPQSFELSIIKEAYQNMYKALSGMTLEQEKAVNITDDAMVIEKYSDIAVKIVEGKYTNIKITTPEDIETAKNYLKQSFRGSQNL